MMNLYQDLFHEISHSTVLTANKTTKDIKAKSHKGTFLKKVARFSQLLILE